MEIPAFFFPSTLHNRLIMSRANFFLLMGQVNQNLYWVLSIYFLLKDKALLFLFVDFNRCSQAEHIRSIWILKIRLNHISSIALIRISFLISNLGKTLFAISNQDCFHLRKLIDDTNCTFVRNVLFFLKRDSSCDHTSQLFSGASVKVSQ